MGLTMDCDDNVSITDTTSALEQGSINDEKVPEIGAKENHWVAVSRLLVIVLLSISTFLSCLLLFMFMSEQEESNFESDVSILASMLLLSTCHRL
jgi:hypothetical protein